MFLAIPRELKDWNWKLHFSLVVLLSLPFLLSFPAPHSKPSSLVGIFSRLALLSSSDPPPPRPLSSREFNFMWLYFPALSLPFFHSFSAWNSFPFIRGLVSLEREENRKKRGSHIQSDVRTIVMECLLPDRTLSTFQEKVPFLSEQSCKGFFEETIWSPRFPP